LNSSNSNHHGCDFLLCITVAVLILFGLVMVFSSSAVYGLEAHNDSSYFLKRQLVWMFLGSGVLWCARKANYHQWEQYTYPVMLATFILLLAVMFPGLGVEGGGARRWLDLGLFSFQPSELAKFALVLFMAKSLVKRSNKLRDFAYGYLPNIIVLGFFFLPILFQPDLGTAIIICAVTFTMMFIGGIRKKFLIFSALAFVPFLITAIFSADYRMRRIQAFLDPWQDPKNTGFQAIQSFYAFGRGGTWGLGLGDSNQKLFYLPEAHTDFIFSVIGEELGFLGAMAVIFLFFVLIWRGLMIAYRAKDAFGTHLAIGITLLIGFQAFINMGVATGLLPTKGLTLPFISMGGSSMVISMLCVGILLNISEQTVRRQ
jgi:cell division protein FtsW